MCIATPGKVIKVDGKKAVVKYSGESRQVLTGGESVKVGDYVMVQMGIVVKTASRAEVIESLKAWGC
jgi:hydrogenase expression/formation protein HypC